MRFQPSAVVCVLLAPWGVSEAFTCTKATNRGCNRQNLSWRKSAVVDDQQASATKSGSGVESLTLDIISKLRFRETQRELEQRALDGSGTFSAMKERLREAAVGPRPNEVKASGEVSVIDKEMLDDAFSKRGINFEDVSDPDFDYKDMMRQINELSEKNHWKTAVRRLKGMTKKFGKTSADPRGIPEDVYTTVLRACMDDKLHGARASESVRKIMECMAEDGYDIPDDVANYCVKNSLGDGPSGTHDGFGGIDTALAMLAAFESSETSPKLNADTYEKLITKLAQDGSIDEALRFLRIEVAEKFETPTLQLFADVATSCVDAKIPGADPEKVMTVMAYAKTAGYELDNVASTVDGRQLLAAGVIAAEKLDNIGLGLRFLTAASQAKGCEPDRGDDLVATSSAAAQRACTVLHRRAINKAVDDNGWKLAVKLLELMLLRGLRPSPSVWRNVVTCCAKAEKSKKATSLLLDWVQLSTQGRAEKPPIRVFNTVVNACEVCGEEELTVKVLDAMKETHDTEGNLITLNIALKRLAKQGNTRACEGLIVGMLTNNIEPSIVSYTTAIAACVADPKQSDIAVEWIKRMKSRRVQPNVITYNTALASCLDGTLEGTARASQLASEMIGDIEEQVNSGIVDKDEYTDVIPNYYTRTLARQAMKQLKDCWEKDLIDRKVAKTTLRVPLLQLVEFLKTDMAELAEKQKEFITGNERKGEEDEVSVSSADEELEYAAAITSTARAAAV